jgi:hypothetical protein
VKGYDSAGTDQLKQGSQGVHRIGKKLQNETANHCVEWFVARELAHIGLPEGHIVQSSLGRAISGSGYPARVTFYPHHLS